MAKQKKSKDIDLDIDISELPDENISSEVEIETEPNSNMGSYTYEELLDKNEDLEKASLRAKAFALREAFSKSSFLSKSSS